MINTARGTSVAPKYYLAKYARRSRLV